MKKESNPNKSPSGDGIEVRSLFKDNLFLCSDVTVYVDQANPDIPQYNRVIELYCYWRSNHRNGAPPARRDIDPKTDIPTQVENLIMINAIDKAYTYRFVGSEVTARLGRDVTGRPIGSIGEVPIVVSQWRSALDRVVTERRPLLATGQLRGTTQAQNAALLLPLVSARGDVEIVLIGSFCNEHFTRESLIEGLTVNDFRPSMKPDCY